MSRASLALCLAANHLRLFAPAASSASSRTWRRKDLNPFVDRARDASSVTRFPACGRAKKRGTDVVAMASLPKGEGAQELIAQSCAALGACSRCVARTHPRRRSIRSSRTPPRAVRLVDLTRSVIPPHRRTTRRDTPKLTAEEVQIRLKAVPTWTLDPSGAAISRSFTAKNWQCAVDFVNALSAIAEEEGHHPDVHLTNYRDVRVTASTHAIGGLSLHDFVLAAKLDTIDVTYSPKWLRENAEAVGE
jgi:4a-hydroxytetrahydrobiopterin dehydratase